MIGVGSKVVCINDDFFSESDAKLNAMIKYFDQLPKKGETYTVRGMVDFNGAKIGLLLEEIKNTPNAKFPVEPNFSIFRFRELEPVKDKILEEELEEVY